MQLRIEFEMLQRLQRAGRISPTLDRDDLMTIARLRLCMPTNRGDIRRLVQRHLRGCVSKVAQYRHQPVLRTTSDITGASVTLYRDLLPNGTSAYYRACCGGDYWQKELWA
ncbi:hypothetical protein [Deinococcus sedimenti]|uniref:Uncharacterized protein n=1 Tax=Deinococcus sedimenti TaxID=1867090 RepID=A0ABQ2S0A3_9DEIO|nr:hypothetical protein [Deinococcus sedimenti]GGR84575.1 hypothetical protein GCM10008960_09510 [Deinococcus sedimenti]